MSLKNVICTQHYSFRDITKTSHKIELFANICLLYQMFSQTIVIVNVEVGG